jgi:GT2 family glycosyltransferase
MNSPTGNVAWTSGGALLVRAEDFFAVGGFDEAFFLYFEDVDLCRRLNKNGCCIRRTAAARIIHIGGENMRHIPEQKQHYFASQDYYIRKHYGVASEVILRTLRRMFIRS